MERVLEEFSGQLRHRLGSRLRKIVLFGSRARGDYHEGSDYDVLIVVDRRSPEIRSIILDLECDILDRYGLLVATILRGEEEWLRSQGFPLSLNIAKEGVVL